MGQSQAIQGMLRVSGKAILVPQSSLFFLSLTTGPQIFFGPPVGKRSYKIPYVCMYVRPYVTSAQP